MSNVSTQNIILIGVGAAGTSHLEALESVPSVNVIAAVDIEPPPSVVFRKKEVPVYHSIPEVKRLRPDIVIVATPTPTHAVVCDEVTKYFPAVTIIVEKPAADNLHDAQRLLDGRKRPQPVIVAFHMAFAPEVRWALNAVTARKSALGHPISVQSWSGDPYIFDDTAESTFGNSWIDSGINALSVIDLFVNVVNRRSLRQLGRSSWSIFEGAFGCKSGSYQLEASVLTSWYVTDSTRSTRIRYSSGAEVVMDHNAVAGYIVEGGRTTDVFGSNGTVPRRTSHYKQLYQSWLVNNHPVSSPGTALRLHTLLLSPIDDA